MKKHDALTAQSLRDLLNYNPETGVFTWLVDCVSIRIHKRQGEVAGSVCKTAGYVIIGIGGHTYMAHVLAWLYVTGDWPSGEVDHRNCIRSDNRWTNLRDIPKAANRQNVRRARKDSGTGVQGVFYSPKGCKNPFTSSVRHDGKQHYLGTFATTEEAHAAYVAKRRELHPGNTL